MEVLILILAVAVVCGILIYKGTGEKALEVLDKPQETKPAPTPVKKPTVRKTKTTATTKQPAKPTAKPRKKKV